MATTNTINTNVTVKFAVNEKGSPPGKLADAELHFNDGVLAGLKLIGFAVWDADLAATGTVRRRSRSDDGTAGPNRAKTNS